ncbi:hypothetical protein C8J56DRAFT_1064343 [Mycena floridula]|nr:hypothetical protein C8J56DRAFT_1064343 [Mycena floridula]
MTFPQQKNSERVFNHYEGNLWHLRGPEAADFHPFVQVYKSLVEHDRLLFQYASTYTANPLQTLRDLRHLQIDDVGYFRYDKEYVDAMTEWIESGEGAASGSTVSSDNDESDTSLQF